MGNAVQDALKNMKGVWKSAQTTAASGGGDDINPYPDGAYTGLVVSADLRMSSSDKLMLYVEYIIADGDHKGKPIRVYQTMADEKGLARAFQWFGTFGVDVNALTADDLTAACDAILKHKPVCKLAIKSKNVNGTVYKNVYLNEVLSMEDTTDPFADPSETVAETAVNPVGTHRPVDVEIGESVAKPTSKFNISQSVMVNINDTLVKGIVRAVTSEGVQVLALGELHMFAENELTAAG